MAKIIRSLKNVWFGFLGTPKAQRPRKSPLNPGGRSLKMNVDGQVKFVTSPLRQGRSKTGHVSDSEIH